MKRFILLCAGAAIGVGAADGLLAASYRVPGLAKYYPARVLGTVRALYMRNRRIVQYEPDCVRYDAAVGYTLRPGSCRFSNPEFDTRVRVNSLGVRDRESALVRPAVVVLGDSLAMGWGVEEEETFARIFEARSGLPTLDAAVSGYGTVREMRLLERIDVSALRYLVIEYCGNDYQDENEPFYRAGAIPALNKDGLEAEQLAYLSSRRYYPGKFIVQLARLVVGGRALGSGVASPVAPMPAGAASAAVDPPKAFLNALLRGGGAIPARAQVVVLTYDRDFADGLRRKASSRRYPAWIRGLEVVDISRRLEGGQFALDDHWNRRGHAAAAEALLEAVAK